MNTENKLTAEESLDIITNMINEAKSKVQRNGFYFLLWGWVVALANLGMYILYQIDYPYPFIVWSITIPAWIISMVRGFREGKTPGAKSHLDLISTWLWLSFGITIFILIAFGRTINFNLNPVILTVSAIPTFLSGMLIRFRPLVFGGVAFWAFGIVSFLLPKETQPLIGAIAVICGYLVPGYMINVKNV